MVEYVLTYALLWSISEAACLQIIEMHNTNNMKLIRNEKFQEK